MVASAEGERGFNFYCDTVRAHACPVMCAVNREATRLDRGEGGQALAHPSRIAASSGGSRKCSSIDARPPGSSKMEVATAAVSSFAAIASLILPAIAASVASRATVVGN
jgi:hypothetical protein